jgi:anaerobic selenocysteine-containing dehydrogenase
MEKKLGVCNLCEAICGLELTIDDGRVTGVRGNPTTRCRAGTSARRASRSPTSTPTRTGCAARYAASAPARRHSGRRSAGTRRSTWSPTASKAVNEHGRTRSAIYLGNPNVHSLGSMTHGVTLVKSFRTRNKFSATSVDQLPHQLVAHLMYGHQLLLPIPDIDRTSYFLVFGANPMASNGSLMTVPDFPNRLRELKAAAAGWSSSTRAAPRPRRSPTEHVFVRPGTDAWVLLAMLHTCSTRG